MIRGVIFDLGSTLLYSQSDGLWETILPRMNADLLASLQTHGYGRLDAEFEGASPPISPRLSDSGSKIGRKLPRPGCWKRLWPTWVRRRLRPR